VPITSAAARTAQGHGKDFGYLCRGERIFVRAISDRQDTVANVETGEIMLFIRSARLQASTTVGKGPGFEDHQDGGTRILPQDRHIPADAHHRDRRDVMNGTRWDGASASNGLAGRRKKENLRGPARNGRLDAHVALADEPRGRNRKTDGPRIWPRDMSPNVHAPQHVHALTIRAGPFGRRRLTPKEVIFRAESLESLRFDAEHWWAAEAAAISIPPLPRSASNWRKLVLPVFLALAPALSGHSVRHTCYPIKRWGY